MYSRPSFKICSAELASSGLLVIYELDKNPVIVPRS